MTNIGTAPCLDQVHVYIDTGHFTTTLLTTTIISSTAMISYRTKFNRLPTGIVMNDCQIGESRELEPHGTFSVERKILRSCTVTSLPTFVPLYKRKGN
jgi:hypothetical protein